MRKTSKAYVRRRAVASHLLLLALLLSASLLGCRQTLGLLGDQPGINVGGSKAWTGLQAEVDQARDGDTIDLTSYTYPLPQGAQYDIIVPQGLSLRLLGYPRQYHAETQAYFTYSFYNVSFCFEGDNSVIIEDVFLAYWDVSGSYGGYPPSALLFQGGDNSLELVGENEVMMVTDDDIPGLGAAIGVPLRSTLTIHGSGSLLACGGGGGAAIGGGFGSASGTITIAGGVITARSGATAYRGLAEPQQGSAAIGGGWGADGGVTNVTGGKVFAYGYCGGAAIGGGFGGGNGTVNISGGYVQAHSEEGAAAIGGGNGASGGIVTVSGGELVAFGVAPGPAIGDGTGGSGGSLTMTGGSIKAVGSGLASHAAIGCAVVSLPSLYTWRAGSLHDYEPRGGQENACPGLAFDAAIAHGFVVIDSH
jgi:hypothetical protein